MWNEIGRSFSARSYDLVLLSPEGTLSVEDNDNTGAETDTGSTNGLEIPSIRIPLALRDYARHLQTDGFVTDEAPNEDIRELIAYDRLWCRDAAAYDAREGVAGYRICEAFARSLRRTLQPAVVLTWGSSLPQNTILQSIFATQHIPVYVLERGLLPLTLMLERWGNSFCSDLSGNFACRQTLLKGSIDNEDQEIDDETPSLYERAKRFYLHAKPTKYEQEDFVRPDLLRQELGLSPTTRVVTFFGQNDIASGFVPHVGSASLVSSIFESTFEALSALNEIVRTRNDDLALVFKPHPDDRFDYETRCDQSQIRILRTTNIHSLFEMSEVIAAMVSTVQFESLFHEKPLLLLGRSQLSGYGIAYEVEDGTGVADTINASIAACLDQALSREGLTRRIVRAKQYVTGLLSHFLFAVDPDVPSSHGIEALTEFLSRTGTFRFASTVISERLRQFQTERQLLLSRNDWRGDSPPSLRGDAPQRPASAANASDALKRALAQLSAR